VNEPVHTHQSIDSRTKNYRRIGVFIAALLVFGMIYLRIQMWPNVDEEELASTYNHLCEVIVEDGNYESLYNETRDELRKAGTQVEVHFLFQFVRRMNGEKPFDESLDSVEEPIRRAIKEQRFDDARSKVREALTSDVGMKPGRGRLWQQLIEKLEIRVENDCSVDF
jgi:hypothetical protein